MGRNATRRRLRKRQLKAPDKNYRNSVLAEGRQMIQEEALRMVMGVEPPRRTEMEEYRRKLVIGFTLQQDGV